MVGRHADPKKKKTKKPKPKRQRDVAEDNLAAEDAEAAEAGPPKLRVLIESRHGERPARPTRSVSKGRRRGDRPRSGMYT